MSYRKKKQSQIFLGEEKKADFVPQFDMLLL
jgi:hypothetical protein